MMKIVNQIFVSLIVLTIGLSNGHAQELYFEKILTQDGEANHRVRQIIQDKNGFLWLATSSGLCRYEGDDYLILHEFHNNAKINHDDSLSLSDSKIRSINVDPEGRIWIGTKEGGLNLVDPESYKVERFFSTSSPSERVMTNYFPLVGI